ncbi:MAG: sodium:alanine symporter family protein [Helicobacteraceae bacterium]|jgi:AGCS family alanine or glycine:cation symporter|nr:sodium:alanine symporter family protein [Helicobacteraceae bacterium]
METVYGMIGAVNGFVWGPVMLFLILGTGLYLTLGLRFLPVRLIPEGFRLIWKGRKEGKEEGEISPFNALMTSLSATIGTGNIAGVATAIFMGGPGAMFWMWVAAFLGMATKYSEAVLAVNYREKDEEGNHVGGPMFYIKNGLGDNWKWLAFLFALFASIASFGIGNTIQANSVSDVLESSFGIPELYSGIVLALLVGLVLIGGIKRIAHVAGAVVPFMAIAYVASGLLIIALNISAIPSAIETIIISAFTPSAAMGGFAGASVWAALQFGVARGIFSNEAGLGSAPIAHAAAKTRSAVRQGLVAMMGTFIDTIVICSITGLAIVVTGAYMSGESGASLSMLAFSKALPYGGEYVVTLGLIVFAFTTLVGWSFYGEKSVYYIFGHKAIVPFRILWVLVIPFGSMMDLKFIWLLADTLNALMAVPNLIAIALLSPVIFMLTKEYFLKKKDA